MKDILEKITGYQEFSAIRANAYYASAEYYRRSHTHLGVVATVVTTIVGTTIFAGIASQLGVSGDEHAKLPSGGVATLCYIVIGLLSISAPVLTGLQTFLKFAEEAEKHRATAVAYDRMRQRLDLFVLRHSQATGAERVNALKEFEEITAEFATISDNSPTVPDSVYNAVVERRKALSRCNSEVPIPAIQRTGSAST